MKKLFLFLAAIAFCASVTLPALAWGKAKAKKPYKSAKKGNFNAAHAKIYKPRMSKKAKKFKAPKGQTTITGMRVSRNNAAYS